MPSLPLPTPPRHRPRHGASDRGSFGRFVCIPDRETCEAELIRELRRGSIDAVVRAYDLHHAALRAFVTRYVGDQEVAEGIIHDLFVELPCAVRSMTGSLRMPCSALSHDDHQPPSPEASLRTFLVAKALLHLRRVVGPAQACAAAQAWVRDRSGAEPAVGRQQLAALLRSSLARLTAEERDAFLLCDIQEHASREAAAILGVADEAISGRLRRARTKLKDWLAAAMGCAPPQPKAAAPKQADESSASKAQDEQWQSG